MSLKDKWKLAGKNAGSAFANFGKALGKTMKTTFTDDENKVEENGHRETANRWKETGKSFGEAGKSLGDAFVETGKTIIDEDDDKKFYRRARLEDLDQVMEAVEFSRELLRLQGNGQWQDGYPNRNDFINDINNGRLFVIPAKDNPKNIASLCALTYREEDYHHLYEGSWITDYPYMVMHRVAVKKEYYKQGYGKKLFELFIAQAKEEGYHSLRIDTHEGNAPMRHLITSFGFIYCGKAILTPDKDRMVFEKII